MNPPVHELAPVMEAFEKAVRISRSYKQANVSDGFDEPLAILRAFIEREQATTVSSDCNKSVPGMSTTQMSSSEQKPMRPSDAWLHDLHKQGPDERCLEVINPKEALQFVERIQQDAMCHPASVDADGVLDILVAEGVLKGKELLPFGTSTHGNCCSCATCHHPHDDCVCDNNRILSAIKNTKPSTVGGR